ncbi:EAL domain-containing protein [Sporomusa aerivorans]|uniref:bifunctional diguanylate cyclase/phosphodiesterase n=1 Tax=Sporomusa aerivorans TaxID=204936 RepID=UPI00352B15D4
MIRQKTTLLFSWIIGLSLLAFAFFNIGNYYLLSKDYYERIIVENRMHTATVAFGVSSFFDTTYRVVGEMAQALELRNMEPAQQQGFIEERFSQHGFFDNIIVQRVPDGIQTARIKGDLIFQPENWWFKKTVQEQKPFVSSSFYSSGFDFNRPVITNSVCFPVRQGDTMVAVLAGMLRTDELQEYVGRYYRGDDRFTYILDDEGKVIVHLENENTRAIHNYKTGKKELVAYDTSGVPALYGNDYQLEQQDFAVPAGFQNAVLQALNGITGELEYQDAKGNVFICSFAPVRMPGYSASWAAVTVQSKDRALAALREAAMANGMLSFVIFAGLTFLLLRQGREIEQGVYKLAENNIALAAEVIDRVRVEAELTAANEELTAMNGELTVVTGQLQYTNEQMMREIEVRQSAEGQLRLRECQYRAMVQLLTDTNAELDTQMQTILDSALQLASAADGSIALFENEVAIIRYVRGIHTPLLDTNLPIQEGLFPRVLRTGRLHYVREYQRFPERKQGELWRNLRTAVMVPLRDEQKVTGCLMLSWSDTIREMEADELELLQQYADLASLALYGARFRENLRQELVERKLLHEKISYMAFHDTLTGLPNRASLMNRLELELTANEKVLPAGMVMFIDLDDLKSINDNFGHSGGDQVIVDTGRQIRECLGHDVYIARLGSDGFIVLLPEYQETAGIARLAERLTSHLRRDYSIGAITIQLSSSIGIARYPQDGTTVEELLKKADMAMYAAKAAGRSCWRFFDPVMLKDAQEKLLLTNSLRRAVENREFTLVYQPQVEIASGKVTGFEVLLRWHSPEHGNVSPAKFIPLAEESRLIFSIGEWILGKACQFIAKLTQLGYPKLRVSVNLSTKQLADKELVNIIRRLIAHAGFTPQQLELEITESALLTSLEEGVSTLRQLEGLGLRMALDDFGTGYSSLTHLRLFPVETLKIDKSFIDTIPGPDAVLVKSLVKFAQELNMIVVAEGVERQEQLAYLADCGCNIIQGYLMSRPLPEKEALEFLFARNSIR